MITIRVREDSDFAIVYGPSMIGIEHSLFDEKPALTDRKTVEFGLHPIFTADVSNGVMTLEFSPAAASMLSLVVISAHRKPSGEPESEWVLWMKDPKNGDKYIVTYSTRHRTGSGDKVPVFPKYYYY